MTEPHGPLHGVKVVACSTAQAGTVPYMLMADLDAEVIKIEVPERGDNSRGSTVLPGLPSTYFVVPARIGLARRLPDLGRTKCSARHSVKLADDSASHDFDRAATRRK